MRRNSFWKIAANVAKRASATALIGALSVSLLTSCAKTEDNKELLVPAVFANEVGICERGNLEKILVKDAHIEGDYEILSFDVDGYILEIYSRPGDEVGKGDSIAALTSADFMEIMQLEEEIEEIKKENKKRHDYLEAQVKLKEKGGENADEERLTYEKEVALMDLKLKQKKERYKKLKKEDIGYNYIPAPANGHIVAVTSTAAGSYITAGTPVAAIATKDTERFVSCEFISEKQSASYQSYYAIINGTEYPLEYVPISKEQLSLLSAADKRPKTRFDFVTPPGDEVSLGDYAAVIIVVDKKENVLTVPVNSVYTDKDGRFVYVMGEDGKRERREVETGLSDGARIEVISGVQEGESVYVEN